MSASLDPGVNGKFCLRTTHMYDICLVATAACDRAEVVSCIGRMNVTAASGSVSGWIAATLRTDDRSQGQSSHNPTHPPTHNQLRQPPRRSRYQFSHAHTPGQSQASDRKLLSPSLKRCTKQQCECLTSTTKQWNHSKFMIAITDDYKVFSQKLCFQISVTKTSWGTVTYKRGRNTRRAAARSPLPACDSIPA